MTPRKTIIRYEVRTTQHGEPLPVLHKELTRRENAFCYWYCNPESEAFLNSARSAIRAGYKKTNAIYIGYHLKQKPHIKTIIDSLLDQAKNGIRNYLWHIAFICESRMFYDTSAFYRLSLKDINYIETTPASVLPYYSNYCIDNIIFRQGKQLYKLPDRNKAETQFFKVYELLTGKSRADAYKDYEDDAIELQTILDCANWKKSAEYIRDNPIAALKK